MVVVFVFILGCDNRVNDDIGYKITPCLPELHDYDVILMGENHISAQIFDIELNMMKYYYSLGIRDFALECSFSEALFYQYYYETGDELCLNYLTRYSGTEKITQFNRGRTDFHKNIRAWYSLDTESRAETGRSSMSVCRSMPLQCGSNCNTEQNDTTISQLFLRQLSDTKVGTEIAQHLKFPTS